MVRRNPNACKVEDENLISNLIFIDIWMEHEYLFTLQFTNLGRHPQHLTCYE